MHAFTTAEDDAAGGALDGAWTPGRCATDDVAEDVTVINDSVESTWTNLPSKHYSQSSMQRQRCVAGAL